MLNAVLKLPICHIDTVDVLDNESLLKIEKREFDRKNVWNDNVPYFKMEKLENYQQEIDQLVKFYGLKLKGNTKEEKKDGDNDENKDDADVPEFDVDELLVRGIKNPRSLWFVPKSIGNVIANPEMHFLRVKSIQILSIFYDTMNPFILHRLYKVDVEHL